MGLEGQEISVEKATLWNPKAAMLFAGNHPEEYAEFYAECKKFNISAVLGDGYLEFRGGSGHPSISIGRWRTRVLNWPDLVSEYPGPVEELVYLAFVEYRAMYVYAEDIDPWFKRYSRFFELG